MLFDEDITFEHYTEEGEECYQGMEFREGFVGMISQVKYFMGDILNKYTYADHLMFQASDDNSTWTTLFAADLNIHEGWNYFTWDNIEDRPKYRFYRFHSYYIEACTMREISFQGVETIDDSNPTY